MKNNLKLVILIFLGILVLASVFFVYRQKQNMETKNNAQELSLLIKKIQEKIQLIDLEKSYQLKTLNNEKFFGQMTDGGGQLIGYFKDGKIYKIIERLGLSYGVKTYEYYFFNGQLISVNEKEEDFPDINNTGTLDYTKVEMAFQGYYYFDNEKLINSKTTGQKRFSENDKTDIEAFLLKIAKENVDLLTKAE